MELRDLKLKGGKYTWEKGDRLDIAAKLDRFLLSEELDNCFRSVKQTVLQGLHQITPLSCYSVVTGGLPILTSNLRIGGYKQKDSKRRSRPGESGFQKQLLLPQLADLEEIQKHRILQEEEVISRMALINEFEGIAKKEETAWRQRSRVTWLKEGDRSTIFFHKTANAPRRENTIDRLNVGEVIKEDPEEITKEIVEFYENLYADSERWRPR
ncbi:uncharacterized protein LOC129883693 [Solanum dulcamara]|uniref:uncharacterized protein LOC129883693 n=1 Tax=Solanum dulcamara TaxID=45834 RepID=UPI002484F5D0|nr:uncharacterized protein LOC129883693 [Solanum dulcamara]